MKESHTLEEMVMAEEAIRGLRALFRNTCIGGFVFNKKSVLGSGWHGNLGKNKMYLFLDGNKPETKIKWYLMCGSCNDDPHDKNYNGNHIMLVWNILSSSLIRIHVMFACR